MRGPLPLIALVLTGAAATAPSAATPSSAGARLTQSAVRAFVARQEAAWNARDAGAFAATFTPDAVFVDQARNSNGGITANGSSPLTQTIAQARRFFATSRFRETATVDRVEVAADGRSARVFGHDVTHIETPGRPARTLCAETEQTVVLAKGRLPSRGQTDTDVRCPR